VAIRRVGLAVVLAVAAGVGGLNVRARELFALLTPAVELAESGIAIAAVATIPALLGALAYALRAPFIPTAMRRRCLARAAAVQVMAVLVAMGAVVGLRPRWPLARELLRADGGPDGRAATVYRAPYGTDCASSWPSKMAAFIG
jgi:hypothetical protein